VISLDARMMSNDLMCCPPVFSFPSFWESGTITSYSAKHKRKLNCICAIVQHSECKNFAGLRV
jgi:hypothetical protein